MTWREGGKAWDRLGRWYAHRAGGDDPLAALGDVGAVRRLLDEAELEAVRAARRQGRSWAEIATKLGVTRQSAWERWRDLDEAPASTPRRSWVTVPNVVGMSVDAAVERLAGQGLVGIHADGPVAALLGDVTVVDQSPESGAQAATGAIVKLFTAGGGDAGVREPRRPRPDPLAARAMLDEPADEAVG